ncbi:MAG TPA: hypothetical protein VFQ45_03230 [Longimicrobium sp.]|nr:hypothetical protein [Longimicrobium sp.]
MLSLEALHQEWAEHPLGRNRARGGRVALGGFLYQLYLTLDRFYSYVIDGNRDAQFVFDGLSDLAELQGDLVYLTQVKATLDARSLVATAVEALAVCQFLDECHPELRDRIRFQIVTRRVRTPEVLGIESCTAAHMGLNDVDAQRWESVRNRFLPVQIRANPKIDLAIRLWPHARGCFSLVERSLGRLFSDLGENRSSDEIVEGLLKAWDEARSEQAPPGQLLGPRELSSIQTVAGAVVHGVRPRPKDVSDGCFMERPAFQEAALNRIRKTVESLDLESSPNRKTIPIFWIVGPSGAGKSVLLLLLMREIVVQGEAEGANYLGELAHLLPRSLTYFAGSTERAVIVVDDLFAPEHRDRELWREIAEVAFNSSWRQLPWILTCGPTEQLKEFKNEALRHPELHLVEIHIDAMSQAEQLAYHTWYQERTGTRVPISDEPILVAAAWGYELRRQVKLSPDAFVARFCQRLKDLDIEAPARAAIALNRYGLSAPEALFAAHETELNLLTTEGVYRISEPATHRRGQFFHPGIAKIIYDAITPKRELVRRADDLARGFGAMLGEDQLAHRFIEWLNAPNTRALLSPELKREILVAMWPALRQRGPAPVVLSCLQRWHEMTREADLDVSSLGAISQLNEWFEAMPAGDSSWGIAFQLIWANASEAQKPTLYLRGRAWLERSFNCGTWSDVLQLSWVWQQLWKYRPERELADLGLLWLYDHPAHASWGRVWQDIFDSGFRAPDLLNTALVAIPCQRESTADLPIWRKVASLEPTQASFISAVTRKLARVRSSYAMNQGIHFLLTFGGEHLLTCNLVSSVADCVDEPGWAYLWQALSRRQVAANLPRMEPEIRRDLILLGRKWLRGREDQLEWSFVWQRLIELGLDREDLLSTGRDWLGGREDRPDWSHVWRRLIELRFEREHLLPIGRDWLTGREDYPDWTIVWDRLVKLGFEIETLISIGTDWLAGREDSPRWSAVWLRLVKLGVHPESLLPVGREWLDGREDHPSWPYVWQFLVEPGLANEELIPVGLTWLAGHEGRAEWVYVWQRLLELEFRREHVLSVGRDWLAGNKDMREWPSVWHQLVELGFEHENLFAIGRDWLVGREDRSEWTFVWRRLTLLPGIETADVLKMGLEWLAGHEDRPEWGYVWQHLVNLQFEMDDLLATGWTWLAGREDKRAWSHVWQGLVDAGFDHEVLLSTARDWLIGREDKPEWNYVWRRLVELGFDRVHLLSIGRDWLSGREDNPGWAFVWQCQLKYGFGTKQLLSIGSDWLVGREDRSEWSHVWQRLVEHGYEMEKLLAIGHVWLVGREHRPEYPYVYGKIQDLSRRGNRGTS